MHAFCIPLQVAVLMYQSGMFFDCQTCDNITQIIFPIHYLPICTVHNNLKSSKRAMHTMENWKKNIIIENSHLVSAESAVPCEFLVKQRCQEYQQIEQLCFLASARQQRSQ